MFRTLAVLVLLATVNSQEHDDIDGFIKDIFDATSSTEPSLASGSDIPVTEGEKPCDTKIAKCVRYYLCDYQHKSDHKETFELLQSTAADSYCPSYLDTCCLNDAILTLARL